MYMNINYNKIVHYRLTYGGSYVEFDPVEMDIPSYPTKGDSITIYKNGMDRFHMRNYKEFVFDGKDWCIYCKECKTYDEQQKHDLQLKRDYKIDEVLN